MSYNKANAEKEWFKWKEAEEQKLRDLGVDEDTIQRLHTYDWAAFNQERRYLQRRADWPPYGEQASEPDMDLPVEDTASLLDSIENSALLQVLSQTDKLTIEMLFLRLEGYPAEEICQKLNVSAYAYYNRIKRLKEKIKKFLGSD